MRLRKLRPEAAWPGAPTASAAPRPRPERRPARTPPGPDRAAADQDSWGVGPAAGRRQAVRAGVARRSGSRGRRPRLADAGPVGPPCRSHRGATGCGPTACGPAGRRPPSRSRPARSRSPLRRERRPRRGRQRPDLQAASVQTTKAGLSPAGSRANLAPRDGRRAGGGDRGQDRAGRRRPARLPAARTPRRSGACCRATGRASSAAGWQQAKMPKGATTPTRPRGATTMTQLSREAQNPQLARLQLRQERSRGRAGDRGVGGRAPDGRFRAAGQARSRPARRRVLGPGQPDPGARPAALTRAR